MMKYVRAISLEKEFKMEISSTWIVLKNHHVLLCDINSGYGSGFLFYLLLSAKLTVFTRRDI